MREAKVVDLIRLSGCLVAPSAGLPERSIPQDLADFYANFGGAIFHPDQEFSFTVSLPCLERSDLVVMGENIDLPGSAEWYVLAKCGDQVISIELGHGPTFGYCYDSFWDSYPTADDSTLIAKSFTELIEKIIASGGKGLFWLS